MTPRRNFLSLCGMMAASGLAGSHLNAAAQATSGFKKKRILILGAGLAGLASARELQLHDHEVIVLEGRKRIGGRIWTSHEWKDMPVDLGASWIHGVRGNPLTSLADQIQAKRLKTSYQRAATYSASGQLLSDAQEKALAKIDDAISDLLENAQQTEKDASILQSIQPLLKKYAPTSEGFQFLHFVLSGKIEQEYSGSSRDLSSHWYDSAKEFEGGDVLFADGFESIIDHLASDLEIQLGQIVQRIEWESSQVRVTTNQKEFTADLAIVTLPLGVLKAKRP
ncbi:MAG: FAD-dependent oxidoreductase [Pirellulales bacterium]